MSYINDQLITTNLYINSEELNKDIDNVIKVKLNDKMGNVCHTEGFIMEGTISIVKRSIGEIVTNNNKNKIKYVITFKCKIISPSEGEKIECYVHNINKMGVISYIKLNNKEVEKFEDSPIISISPSEYFADSPINIEDINIGQRLKIEIIGVRIKYNNNKIQIVSKPIL